jgi:hypothetical protein
MRDHDNVDVDDVLAMVYVVRVTIVHASRTHMHVQARVDQSNESLVNLTEAAAVHARVHLLR